MNNIKKIKTISIFHRKRKNSSIIKTHIIYSNFTVVFHIPPQYSNINITIRFSAWAVCFISRLNEVQMLGGFI